MAAAWKVFVEEARILGIREPVGIRHERQVEMTGELPQKMK